MRIFSARPLSVLLFGAILFIPALCHADVTVGGYFAALSEADLDRAVEMSIHKDTAALAELAAENRIILLKAGVRVEVTDYRLLSGKVKFRVAGSTLELWAPTEAVSRGNAPPATTPTPASPPRTITGKSSILGPVPPDMQDEESRKPLQFIEMARVPKSISGIISKAPGVVSYKVHLHRGRYGVIYTVADYSADISPERKKQIETECQGIWRQLKDSLEAISNVVFESADGKFICSY